MLLLLLTAGAISVTVPDYTYDQHLIKIRTCHSDYDSVWQKGALDWSDPIFSDSNNRDYGASSTCRRGYS